MDSRPNSDLLERSMPSGMLKIRNLDTNELFRYELADTMCPKPQTFDDCPPKRLVQVLPPTPESVWRSQCTNYAIIHVARSP
jgi:hypothetical protein